MTSPAATFLDQLREDARIAGEDLLFTVLGGSVLVPGALRKRLFRAFGARLESPPGARFTLVGSAANLTVGRNVYMNQRVFIEAAGPVTIGDGCALGMEAMILTSSHPIDAHGRWGGSVPLRVTIGDRVWVGARVVVLPGATIGSDVVVAAGAVVVGDCTVSGLYAGVPARRIRDFSPASDPVEAAAG